MNLADFIAFEHDGLSTRAEFLSQRDEVALKDVGDFFPGGIFELDGAREFDESVGQIFIFVHQWLNAGVVAPKLILCAIALARAGNKRGTDCKFQPHVSCYSSLCSLDYLIRRKETLPVKELEQFVAQSRARWRGLRARLPLAARGAAPVRLVLELDRVSESPPTPADWKKTLVSSITWLGPTRVCVKSSGESIALALELVRFCHRLECPTHLVTSGPVTDDEAVALLDRGLGAVTIRVAGLDEPTQQAVIGNSLESAANALYAFSTARSQRSRGLSILVNVPGDPANVDSLEAISGWALQSGADRVALGLSMGQSASVAALSQALPSISLEVPDPLRALLEGKKPLQQPLRIVLGGDGLLLG